MVPGQKSYTLKHPITRTVGEQEETLSTVTVRRPTARDLRIMDQYQGKPMALTLALIERLTGLLAIDVDKIDAEDVDALGEIVFAFVPNGPKTGATA